MPFVAIARPFDDIDLQRRSSDLEKSTSFQSGASLIPPFDAAFGPSISLARANVRCTAEASRLAS